MKYVATVTLPNMDKPLCGIVKTCNISNAHALLRVAYPTATRIAVYPDTTDDVGILLGAVMVAKITAANALLRTGGNATQCAIDRDLRAVTAKIAVYGKAITAQHVVDLLRGMEHDAQDFVGVCYLAMLDARHGGRCVVTQYRKAYRALNHAIHAMRTTHTLEVSTTYIATMGGDLVALSDAVARIIYGGMRYTPMANGLLSDADAIALGDVLHDALAICKPVQRDIARQLACGYSQRQIASAMGRSVATVSRNIATMRKTVSDYIHAHAPQLAHLVPAPAIDAAANSANVTGGRKTAEYYRSYRARRAHKA